MSESSPILVQQNATAKSQRSSQGGTRTLPADLLGEAARRLSWAGFVYSGIWGAYLLVIPFLMTLKDTSLLKSIGVPAVILGLIIGFRARRKRLPPAKLLDVGLVFEVIGCGLIALAENWGRFSAESATWPGFYTMKIVGGLGLLDVDKVTVAGTSWVTVWIVFFPTLVPSVPRKMLYASILAGATVPLTLGLSFLINGVADPYRSQIPVILIVMSIAPALAVVMAWVAARMIYRFGSELRRAREMGSYRLVQQLGHGGMGEVWLAKHRMLARPAAIKLIRTPQGEGGASPTAIRRFEREAQATASLTSPHAIRLYDYGVTSDGTLFYVMELLDGMDLGNLVDRYGPIPPERTVHFLTQACHALAEAHAAGLIHRDIKPANLYACHYGRDEDFTKVLDFGLVKLAEGPQEPEGNLTQEGSVTGTPAYMAPEMISGLTESDGRADIYGLGCVAYFLLTGRPVFTASRAMQIMIAHLKDVPEPPSKHSEFDIPPSLEKLILQCLEKEPDKRPQSPDDLAAKLAECELRQVWTPARARQWWQEHRRRAEPPVPPKAPVARDVLISLDNSIEVIGPDSGD